MSTFELIDFFQHLSPLLKGVSPGRHCARGSRQTSEEGCAVYLFLEASSSHTPVCSPCSDSVSSSHPYGELPLPFLLQPSPPSLVTLHQSFIAAVALATWDISSAAYSNQHCWACADRRFRGFLLVGTAWETEPTMLPHRVPSSVRPYLTSQGSLASAVTV